MTNKIGLAPTAAVFFLIFGAISCAPDKKTKPDTFRLAAPQLQTTTGKLEPWAEFTAKKTLELSAKDELVFGPETVSQSVTVKARARCVWRETNQSGESSFFRPHRLPLLHVLPHAIIFGEPGEEARCAIDFTATNSRGSKHHFSLNDVRIKASTSATGIELKQEGHFLRADPLKAHSISMEFASRYAALSPIKGLVVELLCEKHRLRSSDRNGDLFYLNTFDSRRAEALSADTPPLETASRQYCRFVGRQGAEMIAVSELMLLQFQKREPQVSWTESPVLYDRSGVFHFGVAKIINDTGTALRLKIPAPGEQLIQLGFKQIMTPEVPPLDVPLAFTPSIPKTESSEVRLENGQELKLTLTSQYPVRCVGSIEAYNVEVHNKHLLGPKWLRFDGGHDNGQLLIWPKDYGRVVKTTVFPSYSIDGNGGSTSSSPAPGCQMKYR